ncbi:hypothetical protein PFISCL1PPCAC_15328 [Pristionchus fissidentatus]|uniref:CC domain-containing protein n=1 Tax=Pristionchus fissidentatus TaxID=1538716 RepID=A0AAV5VW79_9BILA|nr:hypothetical protein PFISCL1PPCAC_15328 [Pristionchus fissidentatus]
MQSLILLSFVSLSVLASEESLPSLIPILQPENTSAAVEFPIQRRGRQVYYQCQIGTYSVLSRTPCNTLQSCSAGDRNVKLGVGCNNAVQCTPYFQGPVKCVNSCCCTSVTNPTNPTQPSPSNSGVCYHGQLSQVGCSARGQCAAGQTCMNGLCCTTTGNEYTAACGGLAAVNSCTNGGCSGGLFCSSSNYCCECPVGRTAGRCTNGACAAGFTCMPNGYCCASCPNNAMPFGACRDGVCGNGKTCRAGNICC